MTDAERAALEWLDNQCKPLCFDGSGREQARTLKALLAEPRLPKEPSDGAITALITAYNSNLPWHDVYRALYAHLTAPKTRTVEVWHVEFCDEDGEPCVTVCGDKVIAHARALAIRGGVATCIHITGPHKQEIPT